MPTPNTTITSTLTVTDANNNLITNLSACTLAVTYPDGTSSNYAMPATITNIGSGQYQAKYNTKGAGLIVEVWNVTAADTVTVASFRFEVGVGY